MKKLFLAIIFISLAVALNAQNFRFALLTDLHIRANDTIAVSDLKKNVLQINTVPDIEFTIVAGDITEEGDRESLEKAKQILDKLDKKYYIVSGNHETKWSPSGATDFAKVFGYDRFMFDHQGIKFMGFNTGPIIRMMDGHVAQGDIKWLDEELGKATQGQPVIVVTHYPLFASDVDNWYEATDVLRKFNIKAILGGHYHTTRLASYDGIPAFINRSSIKDKNDNIYKTGGYTIYTVSPDSITAVAHKVGAPTISMGGYSMRKTYYTAHASGYERPDFSVNKQFPNVKSLWKTAVGNTIYASVVVTDKRVYVGDDTGVMWCMAANKGEIIWKFATQNRIVGTAAEHDGVVVFGSCDGYIYGLNAINGELMWKYKANAPVLGTAIIADGVAYIGASDHTFRALDLKTGKLVWEYDKVDGYIETRPLVSGGKVIFGAWDGLLYALDKNTGAEIWKWSGERKGVHFSPAAVWPVAAHGKVFVTAPNRVMSAIDINTGKTVWKTAESVVRETIGVSKDRERIYSKTMQDSVVCYSARGDKPVRLWATNVAYGYDHAPSMPVEKDGVVFGSTKNGIIFAIEGRSGKLLWKHKVGNTLVNTLWPITKSKCIYAAADGTVGCVEFKN